MATRSTKRECLIVFGVQTFIGNYYGKGSDGELGEKWACFLEVLCRVPKKGKKEGKLSGRCF